MSSELTQTNRLLNLPQYQDYLRRIEAHEKNRRLCRHNLAHFLDVARIAAIIAHDEGLKLDRDLIYTTALLHDIGRFVQYEDGTPHERASHDLAAGFLRQLDFSPEDQSVILDAILSHRTSGTQGFNAVFYRADKKSRACYGCGARDECNWSDEKKNLEITY
ncbi:HD domain-containing protein [Eubacterium sp. 1001713B170207_170306_E7]|uniref:HD domain-containing protein n=1 Tax=Eubacterium sp. 1001713B170207_170306_E7 TaxID=2787097 RepID=UPI001899336D|nr:HD domain-containing protein [Eubacterium sp. 1001713B170207_170306_E7]